MSRKDSQALELPRSHTGIFYAFCLVAFVGTLIPGAPWEMQLAFFSAAIGLLAFVSPVWGPGRWLTALAAVAVAATFICFLPAAWFPAPAWRVRLEEAGLDTGKLAVVQWRHALEQYAPLLLLAFSALWFSGHRLESRPLRLVALLFPIGVAVQILLYQTVAEQLPGRLSHSAHFGFFQNRNHSATLLSMAALCAAGSAFQALRDKSVARGVISLACALLVFWTLFAHSISRGGIILAVMGFVLWLVLLGFRYFGRNEIRALGLLLLLFGGVFVLSESRVKTRLDQTVEKINEQLQLTPEEEGGESGENQAAPIDLRDPIMRDTLGMIREVPVTGVGAGQFPYVFPQYREESQLPWNRRVAHPESDWLMLAAEFGLPATLLLAALILYAYVRAALRIRRSRDRALRSACLAASALLPLHGFFDVPGHKPALVLTAILLFTLARPPSSSSLLDGKRPAVRLLALLLAAAGLGLTGVLPFPAERALLTAENESAYRTAVGAYRELVQPPPRSSLLDLLRRREELGRMAEQGSRFVPLDPRWHLLEGLALLPMDKHAEAAERAFRLELTLAPDRIQPPLRQAAIWSGYDSEKTVALWREALDRAERIDRQPGQRGNARKIVERSIRAFVRRHPSLKGAADELLAAP